MQAERALDKVTPAEKAARGDLQTQLQGTQAELDAVKNYCSAALQVGPSRKMLFYLSISIASKFNCMLMTNTHFWTTCTRRRDISSTLTM